MITRGNDVAWEALDENVSRRVLQNGDTLMLVEFRFRQGGIGAMHRHADHEQVGLITRGRFEVTVGDDTQVLGVGDSYYAAKNVPHGVRALEDGTIIDAFTPVRTDFL
ncbi:cupin domain-containing protein [Synoicihabitans lomoniglobus]|uniref:Cupin domain-containing protein n=1 Tax=Synoicihabitans lomoniglobus TaxID=2909285 RepID=A0AAE9ZW13_9BACT|nr:cupin domain-containing protein [Opitutaceae bacterium LMO-M01]WED64436.1 cupin domain-containing protein [Opitutaceae bacterium LMO-M01]